MGPTLKMPLEPQAGAQRCLRPVSRQGSSILRNGNFKYQCYDFALTVPQEDKLLTWPSTKWLWKCSSRTSRLSSHQTPSNCTQMPNSFFLFSCCCSRAWRYWAKDEHQNWYPDWGAVWETYKTGNKTGDICWGERQGGHVFVWRMEYSRYLSPSEMFAGKSTKVISKCMTCHRSEWK